jgi:DNA polymerase-3 subunit alpha
MDQQRATFVERAVARNVPAAKAKKVFELMAHFAGYGFNKSHSAGYALVAYWTAWLKSHYPAEFLAAALTSEMSDKDRVMILQSEARRLGVAVLPPDINRSEECFSVQEGNIRFGLEAVKGVGRSAVEAILEARQDRPFCSLYEFCERVDPSRVNRKCIENLIQAGALDALGGHRAQQLEVLPGVIEWSARARRERESGQVSLFAVTGGDAAPEHPSLPEVQEWSLQDLLRREREAVGFYVSGHPLDEHRGVLERLGVVPIHLLDTLPDNEAILAAGLPTQLRRGQDKRGNAIAFLSLEDFTGTVECLVFHEAYQQCSAYLGEEAPLLVRGRISTREDQKPKLRVEEAVPLGDLQAKGRLTLHLAVPCTVDDELLSGVRGLLDTHPGPSPVWLHVDHQSIEGIQMRLRNHRVEASDVLLGQLEERLGSRAIRLTVGEPTGARSEEIFLTGNGD